MSSIPAKQQLFHTSLLGSMNVLYLINRYELEPLAAGESSISELPVSATKGALISVRAQSESPDYEIYIYPYAECKKENMDVIYNKVAINKVLIDTGLDLIWSKYSMPKMQHETHLADIDQKLYIEVVNKSGVATGDLIIEIAYQQFQ
jgi:hypothetical protein